MRRVLALIAVLVPVAVLAGAQVVLGHPSPLLATFPFSTPGCYPSGSVFGRGGALTFARSNGQQCGAAVCGADEMCVTSSGASLVPLTYGNLLLYSEQLDDAGWTKSASGAALPTVTANAALAPDGTMTAEQVDFPAVSPGQQSVLVRTYAAASGAGSRTSAIDAKAVSGTCTLYTDTFGAPTNYSVSACSINSSSWTRCGQTNPSVSTTGNFRIGNEVNGTTPLPQPACSVYLARAQVNAGSFVGPYNVTTTATSTAAEVATVPGPTLPDSWCAVVKAQPFSGQAWRLNTATRGLAAGGTYGAANSWWLAMGPQSLSGTSGSAFFSIYDGTGTQKKIEFMYPVTSGIHEIAACYSAGTLTAYADGVQQYVATTGTGTTLAASPATMRLGDVDGTKQINASLVSVKICKGASSCLSPPASGAKVLALGDSITWGQGVATPFDATLQTTLGTAYNFQNGGIPGDTVAQATTRWTAFYKGTIRPVTVAVMLGVNDIKNGSTAASTWPTLSALFDDIRGTGATLIPLTITPFKGWPSWTAGRETERQTLNTSIKNYCTTYSLTCVDVGTDMDDGTGAFKAPYDSGDHLHPNQTGADRIATLVRAAFP